MKRFAIVVAMDKRRGIGKKQRLPWHLPADLKYFKTLTTTAKHGTHNAVIMGRKTYESIPEKFRPLPDRQNIVLSHQSKLNLPENVHHATSLEDALRWARQQSHIDAIFVIGGANVYLQAIHHKDCKTLYITQIQHDVDCDVRFPEIPAHFQCINTTAPKKDKDITFSFEIYERK